MDLASSQGALCLIRQSPWPLSRPSFSHLYNGSNNRFLHLLVNAWTSIPGMMLWCLSLRLSSLYSDLWWWGWVTANCIFARQADFYLRSVMGCTAGGGWRVTPYCLLPVGFTNTEGRDQEASKRKWYLNWIRMEKEFIGWLWLSPQPCFSPDTWWNLPIAVAEASLQFLSTELAALHPIRDLSTNPATLPPQWSEFQLTASFYWASKF